MVAKRGLAGSRSDDLARRCRWHPVTVAEHPNAVSNRFPGGGKYGQRRKKHIGGQHGEVPDDDGAASRNTVHVMILIRLERSMRRVRWRFRGRRL